MKLNQVYLALSAALLTLPLALAQTNLDTEGVTQSTESDEIVFTASRSNQKLNTVGSTLNVISEKQLEDGQYQRVSDALATIPGINITNNSANGTSNTFIRGLNSNNILVMIDGVIVNDPAEAGRGFDFSTLDTLNIERIEVLKGPQSTLYGSSASAGVIQIFTKKGGSQGTTLTLEGGSYEHIKTTLQTQGQTDTLLYSIALGLNQEKGISVADKKLGNTERDKFKKRNGSFYINYAPNDWLNFDLMARFDNDHTDLDSSAYDPEYEGYVPKDDLYYYQKSRRWLGRFAINTILLDEKLQSSLIYDVSDTRRKYYNDPDNVSGGFDEWSRSQFNGKLQTLSWQNILTLHPDFQTLFGSSYIKETYSTFNHTIPNLWGPEYSESPKRSINQKSVYLDQHLNFGDRFFNTIGFRYEDHSEFGSKTTYRFTSRFNINDYIAIKGSYGTGFKAPTLYQLYDPIYGNKNLKAETSKGFDLGVVLTPVKHTTIDITYFQQKLNNRVTFIFDSSSGKSTYINRDYTKTRGVEFSTNTRINNQWTLGVNYTYTEARDYKNSDGTITSTKAFRIPKHMLGGHVSYKPNENLGLFTEVKYHGSTLDGSYNLKPYWLVNIAADYKINDDVSVYARVNNVLDKHYYSVWGYGQKRINGAVGVKIKF